MATATIDGLTVNYMTRGKGSALLMLAPGGFDATMAKWTTSGVWKGMKPLDTLADDFTIVAYDRRESGSSGGRVERLSWALFADQAKGLLDHLKISDAYVLGGCIGCSVALAFAARHPEATRGLILHWPVGASAGRSTAAAASRSTSPSRATTNPRASSSARTRASRSGPTPRPGLGPPSSSATHALRRRSRRRTSTATSAWWAPAAARCSTATPRPARSPRRSWRSRRQRS
jgi:pimeloyl-ACP methyl ester carboxylesterase